MKKLDELINNEMKKEINELDIQETIYDMSKELHDLVSLNYENYRKVLMQVYKMGFSDGYKSAKEIKKDCWGGWIE